METRTSLRLRIESRLLEVGLSKSDLCRKVGRSPRWLSDVLAGRQGLTAEAVRQLTEALDVSLAFFAEEVVAKVTGSKRTDKGTDPTT